jgi:uncharacterized Ntn-hydrolase superfamily protein
MHFVTFPLSGRTLNLHKIVMSHDDRDKRVVRVVQEGGHSESFVGDEYIQARIFFHADGVDKVDGEVCCVVWDVTEGIL